MVIKLIFLIQKKRKLSFDTPVNKNEKGELPQSNWENLRNMWNNYYPQARIKCTDIPNYSLLEKDYKDNT